MTIYFNHALAAIHLQQAIVEVHEWNKFYQEHQRFEKIIELPKLDNLEIDMDRVKSDNGDVLVVDGMPAQCGMAILSRWGEDGDTPSKEFVEQICGLLKALRYSAVMCSLNDEQFEARDLVQKLGFKSIYDFTNHRSGNDNTVFVKEL